MILDYTNNIIIDPATGEVVVDPVTNEFITPSKYESSLMVSSMTDEQIEGVVEGLVGSAIYYNAVLSTPAKRGPKPKETVNPFLELVSELDYDDLSSDIKDVITGVGRQSTDNTVINPQLLFYFIKIMPTFTTAGIMGHMNRKREVTGETPIKERYARAIRSTLESLVNTLAYHLDNGMELTKELVGGFNATADAEEYEAIAPLLDSNGCFPQTREEYLDKLIKAGLNSGEIENLLTKRGGK